MLLSNRARGFSIIALAGVLALLLSPPAPLGAQAEDCSGWMLSCASVQVHAEGERLFFYVPNATLPTNRPLGVRGEPGQVGAEAGDRLRVYASVEGMTCDPATGAGCVDITEPWLEAAEAGSEDSMVGAATAGTVDPGNRSCDDDLAWMDPARGLSEEDRPRCDRPIAAYFIVALPAAAFLFAPDGDEPDVVLPAGDDPGLLGGDGTDGGSRGTDDGGSSGGGSGDSGSSGGTGGETGGGETGGGETGGGETGGGDTGGGALPGGGGPPPGGAGGGGTPGMGEVPEPISTTLFGIGLLGYAGARLRQRRADGEREEDA